MSALDATGILAGVGSALGILSSRPQLKIVRRAIFGTVPVVAGALISIAIGLVLPEAMAYAKLTHPAVGLSTALLVLLTLDKLVMDLEARREHAGVSETMLASAQTIDDVSRAFIAAADAERATAFNRLLVGAVAALVARMALLGVALGTITHAPAPVSISALVAVLVWLMFEFNAHAFVLRRWNVAERQVGLIGGLLIFTILATWLLMAALVPGPGGAYVFGLGVAAGYLLYIATIQLWKVMAGGRASYPLFVVGLILPVAVRILTNAS